MFRLNRRGFFPRKALRDVSGDVVACSHIIGLRVALIYLFIHYLVCFTFSQVLSSHLFVLAARCII